MKKVLLICIMIFLLSISYSFAQMGSDMMEGQQGQMGQGQMMEGMMGQEQMMGSMMNMMHQMQGMMGDMSEMMKDMPMNDAKAMADIMQDMSKNMMNMSNMMHRGTVSEKEMNKLQDSMKHLQDRMSRMGTKK
jgi:F0F1-type ATP synthase alpha subunit